MILSVGSHFIGLIRQRGVIKDLMKKWREKYFLAEPVRFVKGKLCGKAALDKPPGFRCCANKAAMGNYAIAAEKPASKRKCPDRRRQTAIGAKSFQ